MPRDDQASESSAGVIGTCHRSMAFARESPTASLRQLAGSVSSLTRSVTEAIGALPALTQVGLLRAYRPDQMAGMIVALRRWGPTLAAGYAAAAACYPRSVAVIDDEGPLTFGDVHRRTTALANGLSGAGVEPGDNVGVLCHNHRGFVEASVALSKLGANAVFLNSSFAGPQLSEAMRTERVAALVYDQDLSDAVAQGGRGRKRFVAWVDRPGERGRRRDPTLESLMGTGDHRDPPPPTTPGRQIILTSGTTGRPRGANRGVPTSLGPLAGYVSRIPLHHRDTTLLSAPLFHAWGFGNLALSLVTGATVILQRRFDPEGALAAIEQHRVTVLVAVPVMLQRIMALPEEIRRRYDTTSLRVVSVGGSALPPQLADSFMDYYGDIVHSLYGSTEVGWVAIAVPEDLRSAPGTAGFPPRGTVVRIVDDAGKDLPAGETGRIFAGSELLFEGYTAGAAKEMLDGLMSTGDIGHLDRAGRLFVEGREDDMIVSGGENVFPGEVEDLLRQHDAVADVAVIGVPDRQFGQRLKAIVVTRPESRVSAAELMAHVRSNLSRFKVPRDVEFVDELPRNPTGKILRRALDETPPDQTYQ
jgi:acyl-CoA synthetase (AMP-forming)/AMP-acid ligase II